MHMNTDKVIHHRQSFQKYLTLSSRCLFPAQSSSRLIVVIPLVLRCASSDHVHHIQIAHSSKYPSTNLICSRCPNPNIFSPFTTPTSIYHKHIMRSYETSWFCDSSTKHHRSPSYSWLNLIKIKLIRLGSSTSHKSHSTISCLCPVILRPDTTDPHLIHE